MSENSSLGEAVLDLTADDSQMRTDIDNAGKFALQKMEKFGQGLRQVGQSMTVGFTLPILAAGGFAINAASDLEESVNAVNVVFGESSEALHTFGKTAATEVGLAQSEFNQLGAVTGAFLTNLGYDQNTAAQETINLTQRAADMASIFNTDVATALEAIQSGLKGEFNPLEQFGVKLNMAGIDAQVMAMGLADSSDAITDNMRAQAALALIYEQTDKFAGDFKNTSDGLANSQKILKAQFTDAAAELGTKLMPYALQFVQILTDLIDRFSALTPEQQKWVLIIGVVVAAIGPLLMIVGGLITAFTAIAGVITAISTPVLIVIAVIAALIAIGYLLYQAWINNWGGIQEKVAAVWAYIQPVLQGIWDWLSVNIPLALQMLAGFWTGTLLPAIMAVWGWMNGTLFPYFRALANFLGAVLGLALRSLAGIWQNVLQPAIKAVWNVISAQLMPIFQRLVDFWKTTLQPILQKIAEWIGERVVGAFNSLSETLSKVTGWLNDVANKLNSMSLPSWMTPGSPTPWEIGLLGVNDALRKVSGVGLPSLNSSLTMMPAPALSGMGALESGSMVVNFTYSPFVSTSDEYEAEQKLRGIFERLDRQRSKK